VEWLAWNGFILLQFPIPEMAVIVMSGRYCAKDIFADGFEPGGRRRYLKKPFLLSQLQAVVAELELR